jgi:hypothetical protein
MVDRRLPRAAEEQDVAVRVGDLKASQPVVRAARDSLPGQRGKADSGVADATGTCIKRGRSG